MKVYSTALFGEGEKYTQYLPAFVLAACNLFPRSEGWQVRIHTDDNFLNTEHGGQLLCLFGADLIELRVMDAAPLTKAMLWRVAPVFEDGVTHVFCRDIDAPPMPRDRAVCDQFVMSEAAIGTCHDNVAHFGVMGGLCHFDTKRFIEQTGLKALDKLYKRYGWMRWALHGADQDALNRLVRETPNLTLLEHRFGGWKDARPGATNREAGIYACKAFSTRTPDVGAPCEAIKRTAIDSFDYDRQLAHADRLGAHLGCAGYDHEAARSFWERHGDPAVSRIVHSCEFLD